MKRFKKILLVCDEQGPPEAVIDRACALAEANDAEVTLMDVMQRGIGDYARFLGGMTERATWDLEQQVFEQRGHRLREITADMEKRGVSVKCLIAQGVAFIEVIGEVLRNGHDLVMKDATGSREGRKPVLREFGPSLAAQMSLPGVDHQAEPAQAICPHPRGRGSPWHRCRAQRSQHIDHGPGNVALGD